MAYTAPSAVVAAQAITASLYNTYVKDNIIDLNARLGQQAGIYTTEAVRDAAITSPTEGMVCYLTAPTVPAATGTTTMIPSGIRTVYNGSVWVCVTEVAATTPASGTTTSTSFTATLSGSPGTNPSVTLVTGTTAMIMVRAGLQNGTAGSAALCSVAVSGATTKAAALDDQGIAFRSATASNDAIIGSSVVMSGLTAGTNTFTLNYATSSASTSTFVRRTLAVRGIA